MLRLRRPTGPPARTLRIAAAACALAAIAGCGNSRTAVPSLAQPASPTGFHALGFPGYGVAMLAPKNWNVIEQHAPIVTVVASGAAFVTLWRFPRSAPPPQGSIELAQARAALIRAAEAKGPGFEVIRSKALTIDHRAAVEVDAFERVGGSERRVRSTHIYVQGAEYVLDEYAPVAMFHAVDHAVFSPIKHSLRLLSRATA